MSLKWLKTMEANGKDEEMGDKEYEILLGRAAALKDADKDGLKQKSQSHTHFELVS